MQVDKQTNSITVTGRNNAGGVSVAHLYCSEEMQEAVTDTFFCAPTNWKNVTDKKGKTVKYPNHWHFSATTPKAPVARFLTIIDTHDTNKKDIEVIHKGDSFQVGDWEIHCNLTPKGKAAIRVSNKKEKVSLEYDAGKKEGKTIITDEVEGQKIKKELSDYLPDFEI